MCSSTTVISGGVFLLLSPMCRQSRPKLVKDDKLFVALLLTLLGKRSWLLSLPLRWDNCWYGRRNVLPCPKICSFHPV